MGDLLLQTSNVTDANGISFGPGTTLRRCGNKRKSKAEAEADTYSELNQDSGPEFLKVVMRRASSCFLVDYLGCGQLWPEHTSRPRQQASNYTLE